VEPITVTIAYAAVFGAGLGLGSGFANPIGRNLYRATARQARRVHFHPPVTVHVQRRRGR
jgi:hypothetical protein